MSQSHDRLDAIGIIDICERIEAGDSYRTIAADIGVHVSQLWGWLDADPDRIDQSARARTNSAESWLDRGLGVIDGSLRRDSGIDPTAARAYAQECARRAAIRNPRYSDRVRVGGDPESGPVRVALEGSPLDLLDQIRGKSQNSGDE